MYEQEQADSDYGKVSNFFGSFSNSLFKFIQGLIILSIFFVMIYLFVAAPHEVVGSSMYPTFKDGEYIIGSKIRYIFSKPKIGDVVIYEYDANVDYIKRVIGIPGDEVSLINGQLYVNGEQVNETEYLDESIYTDGGVFLYEGGSIHVPEDEYFTVGDNRPGSYDSRHFGTVHKSRIKAKIFVAVLPIKDFRLVLDPKLWKQL